MKYHKSKPDQSNTKYKTKESKDTIITKSMIWKQNILNQKSMHMEIKSQIETWNQTWKINHIDLN